MVDYLVEKRRRECSAIRRLEIFGEMAMSTTIEIVLENPFATGVAEGKKLGARKLAKETAERLGGKRLSATLGAMSRKALEQHVISRLETPPDYTRFPELADLYPERVDYLRGLAKGAGVSLEQAAVYHYVAYRDENERWFLTVNDPANPTGMWQDAHCSGVLMAGPDGVLGGQSAESLPPMKKPRGYRWKNPGPCGTWKTLPVKRPDKLVLHKPRTGYISDWGATNEKGVACCCGNSCSVWLDEPIEDTWPVQQVPLLRFAADVGQLAELYTRYTLHNWSRASQIWADTKGQAVVIEKSFRRIGVRRMGSAGVLWCTEGHWESPSMQAYIHQKRLDYLSKMGKHLGAGDMQYATDCTVRFTRLGELCHEPLGRGIRHLTRVLTDHATFPRAVCRHGGPDTAPYDQTVTMASFFKNLTRNRAYSREWVPWKKFPCQRPWGVTEYPPIPG
ncbi:MAG: hypothetical protein A2269_06040 [Lentisphaerae bacterium RIFOXYA12_FULL_60_10]|nr:MAG: hypothetical protein A2269_06040 [Lentisphaerae bacterium RIFOXYA12_FULL_60_10]